MKTPASQSPAEVMFARQIRSVYDKLLPKPTKPATASIVPKKKKKYYPGEKVYFKMFKDRFFCEAGTIGKRIGDVIYIVKEPQFTHKRHLNQIKKRSLNVSDSDPAEDVAMEVIYDTFDIPTALVITEVRRSKRKRKRRTCYW